MSKKNQATAKQKSGQAAGNTHPAAGQMAAQSVSVPLPAVKPDRKRYQLWLNREETIEVYADEVAITQNGDIVFNTFVETGLVVEGQQGYDKKVSLIQARGTWERFEEILNGSPLWKQSGKIAVPVGE